MVFDPEDLDTSLHVLEKKIISHYQYSRKRPAASEAITKKTHPSPHTHIKSPRRYDESPSRVYPTFLLYASWQGFRALRSFHDSCVFPSGSLRSRCSLAGRKKKENKKKYPPAILTHLKTLIVTIYRRSAVSLRPPPALALCTLVPCADRFQVLFGYSSEELATFIAISLPRSSFRFRRCEEKFCSRARSASLSRSAPPPPSPAGGFVGRH